MIKEITVDNDFIESMKQYREATPEQREKGILYACSQNLILFSEKMINLKPYAWQVYVMKDIQKAILNRKEQYIKIYSENTIKDGEKLRKFTITIDKEEFVILTSRQIGKSTMLALLSLWVCTFNHIPSTIGNNTSVIIVSAGDTQAKKLLNEINRMIRLGDARMKEYGYDNFFSNLLDDSESNNKQQISFKPHQDKHGEYLLAGSKLGSTIKSYPPTSIVLGETGSLIIEDEAGKSDKITDEFHKEYLYPTGNSTHALRMYTSTPWVTSGFFYKLCDPDDMFEHKESEVTYCFTIDAIKLENPAYYETVQKDIKREIANGNLTAVQRAYYCRFVKGEVSFFDPEDVINSFSDYNMYTEYKGECDLGVDFGGQTTSRTVLTISKLAEDGKIIRLYHKYYNVGEDNNLLDDIQELMTRFNIQRIIPDDCPQGDYLIREMKERGWNVQPMSFATWKIKKYTAFRAMLHRGYVSSYNDEDLKTEMLSMEQHQGARNTVIKHASGYTDDMIDSFVMSCFFYVNEENGIKSFDWDEEESDGGVFKW